MDWSNLKCLHGFLVEFIPKAQYKHRKTYLNS